MAVNRGTEAYDLSLFEPKPAKIVELKPNKKMQKAKQRKNKIQSFLNTVATLSIATLVITVMGLMITSRVRLTEMDGVINEKRQALVVLESEKTRLTDELARKTSTKSVEEYATNVLGMQKMESNQIEYMPAEIDDKVEMTANENSSVLETIGKSISNFFTQLAYLFE